MTTFDLPSARRSLQPDGAAASFLTLSTQIFCAIDTEGVILDARGAWQTLLGFDPARLGSRRLVDFIHPEDAALLGRDRLASSRHDDEAAAITVRCIHADGSLRRVAWLVGRVDSAGIVMLAGTDVTERVGPATLRGQLESTFRTAQEMSPDGFMILRTVRSDSAAIADFEWIYANPAAARIVGRRREDLVGERLLEALPGGRAEGLFDACVRVAESGASWQGDLACSHEVPARAFRVTAIPVAGGIAAIFGDITERHAGMEAARRERHRLMDLFQRAPAFICTLRGPEHVFELANDCYRRLVGDREVLGRPVRDALPELVEQGFIEVLDHVLATGEPFVGTEIPVLLRCSPDAPLERRFLNFVYQALEEPDGTRSGILVHGVDVTEQARMAATVRISEERARHLLERSADVVTVLDLQGTVRYANPPFEHALGFSIEEVLGRCAFDLVHPEDRASARAAFDAVVCEAEPMTIEMRVAHRDGSWRTLDLRAHSMLADPAVAGIVVSGRDMTQHRQLEEQLRHAQRMEAVGKLAGGVAHDFNNLITVIKLHSEMLIEDSSPADPRRGDLLEIRQATERAADLTRQLLAFSRKQILAPAPLALGAALDRLNGMLRRLIGEDVEIVMDLDPSLAIVELDAAQFEQVVINLVVNARDAMPGGGTITIAARNVMLDGSDPSFQPSPEPGPYVRLSVTDTGSGMSDEVRERIFEPFFTTKEQGQGTGLGLATVYGIVKQSNGYIWCRSRPGEGTTFEIYFPRSGRSEVASAPPAVPRARGGTETILLVEDEQPVRALARRILERQGYRVLESGDGLEALELSARHVGPIHLLLTDTVMPRLGGGELAQRLETTTPGLRVLFMSGYTDDEVLRRGVVAEQVNFLPKPFTAQELATRVRAQLDG